MKKSLKDIELVVDRLILQYREYLLISEKIEKLKNSKLVKASQLAKSSGEKVRDILRQECKYEELRVLNSQVKILEVDLSQISDEMTFKNHIVWMMYKFKAYKGASNEISTLRDFRDHCSPEGYICTKRYRFLRNYILESTGIDIESSELFPEQMSLEDFYTSDLLIRLLHDSEFISKWQSHEYFRKDGKVSKWENFG